MSDVELPGRRLADEPLRLLPLFSGPPRDPSAARPMASLVPDDRPHLILRAGRVDAERIADVLSDIAPDVLAVNLTEPDVIKTARRVAARNGVPFSADPVLHRMAEPGYAATPGLRRLRYRPPDGEGPWTAADLRSDSPRIARAVIEEQELVATGAMWAATVGVNDPHDPRLASLGRLLQASAAATAGWGTAPVLAPVICRLDGFLEPHAQEFLVRAFGQTLPAAFVLFLDGARIDAPVERLLAAADLMQRFGRRGAPVLIGRAGPTRRLWLALGADGVEVALGRLERFVISEQRGTRRGPGNNPPRWEVPELLCSLPRSVVEPLLSAGRLPCLCKPCAQAQSLEERLDGTVAHNAAVLRGDLDAVAGLSSSERTEQLQEALVQAQRLAAELNPDVRVRRHLVHLRRWPEVLAEAQRRGMSGQQAA